MLAACGILMWRSLPVLLLGFLIPNAVAMATLVAQGAAGAYIDQVWKWGLLYSKTPPAVSSIGDGLWHELRAAFDETQILELVALAGFYHTICYFTNALRIAPESYAARFPLKAQPIKAAR